MVNSAEALLKEPEPTQVRVATTRRRTRAIALQVLYEIDSVAHDSANILDSRIEDMSLSPSAEGFARSLVEGILANLQSIDTTITEFAPSWPLSQMAIVDRNILRMAIYELLVSKETPHKVVINEAVELAKVFGTESSPKFVNGVLGSVMEESAKA